MPRRLLLAVAWITVVGCEARDRGPAWRAAGASAPRDGGTLRMSANVGIRTLDPAIAYDEVSWWMLHPVVDRLVDYEAGGTRLVPRLAARWEVSVDGLTYRFWLRDDITYSDGRPIVAADFVFALERPLTTAESPFAGMLADVAGAQDVLDGKTKDCAGITALSDGELEIKLARANAAFLYVLAMPFAAPLRADHVASAGDALRTRPLASGPYQLVEWDEGRRAILARNPRYHDKTRQHVDRIVLLENVARDVQFLMFERGELDVAERLSAPDFLWLSTRADWKPYIHQQPMMNAFGSRMNTRKKPFDDRRVRQALNYALDKRHVVKLLNGTAVASHGMLPPGAFGRDEALAPYPHDPAKARALLAEAGYGKGLVLDYTTLADEDADKLASSLQADLAAVGITLKIDVMSFATYATAVGKADGPAFSIATWLSDFPDPTGFFDPKFHSRAIADDASSNDSFYTNAELDALLDAARVEPDRDKRAEMYRRAERILYDDAPWIWGYHQMLTEVTQPYVRGYVPHPIWGRDYTSAWLDLGPDRKPLRR